MKSEGSLDASKPIRWRKDIAFDFGEGQQVTGFAALRERGTSMGQSGFALLRRGRLIEGSDDEAWSPYGAATTGLSQRVFGELELTGFDVSHTKTGFRWEDQDDEDSFIDLLRESLDSKEMPLETEATKGRWQRTDKRELENRAKVAEEATRTTAEELGSSGTVALDPNRTPPPTDPPGGQEDAPSPDTLVEASNSFLISLDDGEQWEIEVKSKEDPLESHSTWYRFEEIDEESTPKRATCTMLLDNPFSLRWLTDQQRQHPLVRIVAALAVAELKFRNHRQVDQLRRDFNSLLTHSLSG